MDRAGRRKGSRHPNALAGRSCSTIHPLQYNLRHRSRGAASSWMIVIVEHCLVHRWYGNRKASTTLDTPAQLVNLNDIPRRDGTDNCIVKIRSASIAVVAAVTVLET